MMKIFKKCWYRVDGEGVKRLRYNPIYIFWRRVRYIFELIFTGRVRYLRGFLKEMKRKNIYGEQKYIN